MPRAAVLHGLVGEEAFLDRARADAEAAVLDEVLRASGHVQAAVGIEEPEVFRAERTDAAISTPVVGEVATADLDEALRHRWARRARLVDDAETVERRWRAARRPVRAFVVEREDVVCHRGRRLGEAVADRHGDAMRAVVAEAADGVATREIAPD